MSEPEFEVIDALYFIKPFAELIDELQWPGNKLKDILGDLFNKGWIKCYRDPTHEIARTEVHFEQEYHKYHYLATKAGLMAHIGSE
jgi:hypothetical protein